MTWDAKTNGLPADFNDRYPIPKEKDEVTLRGGPFQIPSGGVVDLTESIIAASSSTMPETVKVNNVTFTQVADMSLINASGQYWVDRGNSRLHFHTSDVGAMITQAKGWFWGTHVRKKHWLEAYTALKDVVNVLKPLGDALQTNAKLQVMLEAQAVNDLLFFNPATYNGTKAYVRGIAKWYYSNGISWVPETSGGDHALTGAQVTTISPANFALITPLSADIVITFDMSMQAVAIELRDKNGNLKSVAAGQASNYGKTWTFDPVSNLSDSESPYTVIVRISSVDVLGRNLAADRYYYFATQADPAPVADQISAIDGSVTNAGLAIKFEALGADFPPTNPVYRDLYIRLNDTGEWSLFAANIALVWDSGLSKYKYIVESGLQKGTLYGIKVRIRDASTQWADSNPIAITTAEDMSPPALLSSQIAVSNISANGCLVTTSGTQPTDPDDPDAAITFLLRVAGNSTPYGEYTWAALQTGVLVNHAFGYGEKAISLQVKSTLGQKVSFSAETAKTFSVPVPVPTGLAAVGSDQKVTLNWTGIGVSGATYNLYFSTSPGVTKSNGTKIMGVTSPYEHTGRVNDTAYYYVVTAVVDGVESADSSQASAIPSANQTPSATITASAITSSQMTVAGVVSGIGAGDSVNTIRVAYCLGPETADQAVTAGRFFDITGAGITAYQSGGNTQTGLSLNGSYTVAVRVLENMSGGGTQWGGWTNGGSFQIYDFSSEPAGAWTEINSGGIFLRYAFPLVKPYVAVNLATGLFQFDFDITPTRFDAVNAPYTAVRLNNATTGVGVLNIRFTADTNDTTKAKAMFTIGTKTVEGIIGDRSALLNKTLRVRTVLQNGTATLTVTESNNLLATITADGLSGNYDISYYHTIISGLDTTVPPASVAYQGTPNFNLYAAANVGTASNWLISTIDNVKYQEFIG